MIVKNMKDTQETSISSYPYKGKPSARQGHIHPLVIASRSGRFAGVWFEILYSRTRRQHTHS